MIIRNSALQNIFHTPDLIEWFGNEKNKKNFKDGGLAQKLSDLWELKKGVPNANSLRDKISDLKQCIGNKSLIFKAYNYSQLS